MKFLSNFFGHKKSIPDLKQAISKLENNDPYVREEAIKELEQIGGDEATEVLINILMNGDKGLRGIAASALGKIGGQSAIAALRQVIVNENSGGWDMAILALAKHKDATILKYAIDVLGNSNNDWYIRTMAARALGDLGDSQAIGPLKAAMQDSNSSIRAQATTSLQKFPDNDEVVEKFYKSGKATFAELMTAYDKATGDPKAQREILRQAANLASNDVENFQVAMKMNGWKQMYGG
jgi:HEAT repeat protein